MPLARFLALTFALVSLFVARAASASMIVPRADGDVRVGEVRVAFSAGPTRTVAWEQLSLSEARGELAWLVAVPRGGWIEPADAHFFESLDEATAPVIAPAKSLECGVSSESTALPRGTLMRPVSTTYPAQSPTAALEKLTALGFVVDPATRAAVLSLDALSIPEDVAILILPPGPRGVTRIARVLGPSTRVFPSSLVSSARMTGFVFAAGRAQFFGLPSREIDLARLSWASNRSNHGVLLDEAISAASPGAVTLFAGVDGVFADQPAGSATVPSFLRRYFAGEVSSPAIAECVTRAAALGFSHKIVTPTCAKSSSWATGTPPACAVPTKDQIPASDLSCGALDDLAVAVGGQVPSRVVLTRLEGLAAPAPRGRPLELLKLGSVPSFREAKLGPLCTDPPSTQPGTSAPGAGSDPPPATSEPDPAPSGGGGSSSGSGDGCASTAQVFADSCSRSSSSGGGGCSGDSSSESDGCGGDSSGGDSCSGSSDSADDGCSSGSGSSSSCKGASDSADDGCRSARRTPRVRFSAAIYLLIAVAAIARRIGRRSGYDSSRERRCPTETTSSNAPVRE